MAGATPLALLAGTFIALQCQWPGGAGGCGIPIASAVEAGASCAPLLQQLARHGARFALQDSRGRGHASSAEGVLTAAGNKEPRLGKLILSIRSAAEKWDKSVGPERAALPTELESAQMQLLRSTPAPAHKSSSSSSPSSRVPLQVPSAAISEQGELGVRVPCRVHVGGLLRAGRGDSESEKYTRDDKLAACGICGSGFGFFSRRHHCRACRRLVCGDCSGK